MTHFLLASILIVLILILVPSLLRVLGLIFFVLLMMAALGHFTQHDDAQRERPAVVITSPTPSIAPVPEITAPTTSPATPQPQRRYIQQ